MVPRSVDTRFGPGRSPQTRDLGCCGSPCIVLGVAGIRCKVVLSGSRVLVLSGIHLTFGSKG